uniref:Uncharacterized protein n=1 Tax=Rhizophora mucronata TaxID=61149 RepID=A0A2P2J3M6_RHIMU
MIGRIVKFHGCSRAFQFNHEEESGKVKESSYVLMWRSIIEMTKLDKHL